MRRRSRRPYPPAEVQVRRLRKAAPPGRWQWEEITTALGTEKKSTHICLKEKIEKKTNICNLKWPPKFVYPFFGVSKMWILQLSPLSGPPPLVSRSRNSREKVTCWSLLGQKKNRKKNDLWDLAHLEAETLGTSHRTPSRKHRCFLCLKVPKNSQLHTITLAEKKIQTCNFSHQKKKLNPKLSALKKLPNCCCVEDRMDTTGTPHPNPAHLTPRKGSVVPLKFALPTYFFLWHSGKHVCSSKESEKWILWNNWNSWKGTSFWNKATITFSSKKCGTRQFLQHWQNQLKWMTVDPNSWNERDVR